MNEVYFLLDDKNFSHSEGEDRDFKGEGSDFEGEVCGYRPEVCPSCLLKEDGAGMRGKMKRGGWEWLCSR